MKLLRALVVGLDRCGRRLTIVDRPGLEAVACECYRIVSADDEAERV